MPDANKTSDFCARCERYNSCVCEFIADSQQAAFAFLRQKDAQIDGDGTVTISLSDLLQLIADVKYSALMGEL